MAEVASRMIWNEFISALSRQRQRRSRDSNCTERLHTPTDRTHYPGFIEEPADEEPGVVFVQICLGGFSLSLYSHVANRRLLG